MNKSAKITSLIFIIAAAVLLLIAFLNSAVPTVKIGDLLSGKIDKSNDLKAIFQCYYMKAESENEFTISELIPCTNPEAPTILVKLNENVQKPELYRGAQLFLHGTFIAKENFIQVSKIEASCPAKRMEMLENAKKRQKNNPEKTN